MTTTAQQKRQKLQQITEQFRAKSREHAAREHDASYVRDGKHVVVGTPSTLSDNFLASYQSGAEKT